MLRRAAYKCLNDYAGHQVLFISQTEEFSKLMMRRFQNLFLNTEFEDLLEDRLSDYTCFSNGCEVYSRPSSAQSLRSFDRVKGVYLDEAAHFVRLDDEEIYAAVRPNLINTKGDFVIVSTPRGQRGFFHKLFRDDDSFRKFVLPYSVAPALISPDEIEKEKQRLGSLFSQEYECKFVGSHLAAIEPELIEEATEDYTVPDLV